MANEPRVHKFHAEAGIFHATFRTPITQEVKPQAYVKLPQEGGYLAERSENYRLEGVVTFRHAYTHVSGHKSPKPGHGWVALATAATEGLNVMEVVTADRVVAQISTEHPAEGYVPTVTFLGTRFENLRIAGKEVKPRFKFDFFEPKPANDVPYVADPRFIGLVSDHHKRMSKLPDAVRERYSGAMPNTSQVATEFKAFTERGGPKPQASVHCSLVERIDDTDPWTSAGNVIQVPGFGTIYLAELRVDADTFEYTAIRFELGCIGDASANHGKLIVNGSTAP